MKFAKRCRPDVDRRTEDEPPRLNHAVAQPQRAPEDSSSSDRARRPWETPRQLGHAQRDQNEKRRDRPHHAAALPHPLMPSAGT